MRKTTEKRAAARTVDRHDDDAVLAPAHDALAPVRVRATAHNDVEEIVAALSGELESGDVVLVMSNGAFGNIWQKLLDALVG